VKSHRWIYVLVAASALCATRPGYADEPKRPAAELAPGEGDEQARKWVAEGNKAYAVGDWVAAEKAYSEAFKLKPQYDIAGNLGIAQIGQDKFREAAQNLAYTLRLFPVTGDPETRKMMQRPYDLAKQYVGALKVRVNVKGADVLVDGKSVGEAPLLDPVYVEAGEHKVEAKLTGYHDALYPVRVDKGSSVDVQLNLMPMPKAEGGGEDMELVVRKRSKLPAIIAGGVAVAAAGVGVAMMVVSAGKKDDALVLDKAIGAGGCTGAMPDGRCQELRDTAYQVDTFHNVGVGAFIGAGVLAAAAVGYLVWPQQKVLQKKVTGLAVQAAPVIGRGQGGIVFSGSF